MTRPVSESGTSVYFDSIGLETEIVCTVLHSDLFVYYDTIHALIYVLRSNKHGQPCQIPFFRLAFRAQRSDIQKAVSEYQVT